MRHARVQGVRVDGSLTVAQAHAHDDAKPREALIALGANLAGPWGAPLATIRRSLRELAPTLGADGTSQARASALWRTPAWPGGAGPDYVNAALALPGVTLDAAAILARLHELEARAGRTRAERWAPRPLDLDLIALGDVVAPDAETQALWREAPADRPEAPLGLVLPHPRLEGRAFVLAPLAEVAPGWCHPLTGLSVAEMLAALPEAARAGLSRIG